MKKLLQFIIYFSLVSAQAQNYESFIIGDATDVSPTPTYGLCLMGGATENDQAMIWLLNRANGGDVVVLRTSGSNGYNDYMFNQLGMNLDSVETLVINNANGATEDYVLNRVSEAELIWLAGGDQWLYVDYFKGTPLGDLINDHINQKQAPIGGTSAGMAVLSDYYFDAQNGTVTSNEALSNPFDYKVSINDDFLNIPFLQNTITDTHYDNPVRKGRHSVFMARMAAQNNNHAFGIAAEEFTAVCIDENGLASVYGEYPNFDDFAYFIRSNCENADFLPENVSAGDPLNWNRNQSALKVYKVPGTANGSNTFDLTNWSTGSGGTWHHWWVENGVFNESQANPINCTLRLTDHEEVNINIYPNPVADVIHLQTNQPIAEIAVFNLQGKQVYQSKFIDHNSISVDFLSSGIYLIKIKSHSQQEIFRFIKD